MSSLAGTAILARHDLRRDRILAPVWVLVLLLMVYASAAATPSLYDTAAEQEKAAEAINGSPAIVALYGPILDVHSPGQLAMTKMTVLYTVFAAILFIVMVRRHTRVDEESGNAELVGGGAIGRDAPLAAVVAESMLIALVLGSLVALASIVGGLEVVGSVAFGAMWAGSGLVATGIAALACQLSASARTCAAFSAATLGALFVIRAVGDTSAHWLSWLSPFGWNTQLDAYSDERWWVLGLYVVLAAVLVGVAQLLRGRRDLGAGLVQARPGPVDGSPRLADALALALRVHGTAILLWSAACAVMGLLFGFIAPTLDDFLDSSTVQSILDKLGGLLIAAILSVLAVVISCFSISVISHAGADEGDGRTEAVLATATSRTRWLGASLIVAILGATWLLLVTGVALWVGYASTDGTSAGDIVAAALGWAPAVWVVAGLAAVCLAVAGRWAVIGWVWPALFLVLTLVGELLELPGWVTGLSPYSHVPQLPAEPWSWPAELGLAAVAAVLVAIAWFRFSRRDIG